MGRMINIKSFALSMPVPIEKQLNLIISSAIKLLKDNPEAEIERIANMDAKIQHPIITNLLSCLSDRDPIGH